MREQFYVCVCICVFVEPIAIQPKVQTNNIFSISAFLLDERNLFSLSLFLSSSICFALLSHHSFMTDANYVKLRLGLKYVCKQRHKFVENINKQQLMIVNTTYILAAHTSSTTNTTTDT